MFAVNLGVAEYNSELYVVINIKTVMAMEGKWWCESEGVHVYALERERGRETESESILLIGSLTGPNEKQNPY